MPCFIRARTQIFCPATVLVAHETVHVLDHDIQGLLGSKAIETRLAIAVFNPLHDAGDANFDKFVQIAGSNGQKLHPLQ